MNGLNDALTIGIVLTLVFGALFFYLYSRVNQVEKRVGLTENILLDLKMATENTLYAMGRGQGADADAHPHIEAVGAPKPLDKADVEPLNEEEFYRSVLQGVETKPSAQQAQQQEQDASADNGVAAAVTVPMEIAAVEAAPAVTARVDVNYESMTLKELKAIAKQRGLNVSGSTHKKDVIDALKRAASGRTPTPLDTFPGGSGAGDEEGFPVEVSEVSNA